jgi:hypothetical protein
MLHGNLNINKNGGTVKSPDAALRYMLPHCGVRHFGLYPNYCRLDFTQKRFTA